MSMQHGIYRQFLEGKHTDLAITCGGRDFNAHRVVLCAQSNFFAKMCEGDFKEAHERVVDLPEDDPEILENFLSYMYTGEYADGLYIRHGKPSPAAELSPKAMNSYLADIGSFITDYPLTIPTADMGSTKNGNTTQATHVDWHCPTIQNSVSRQVQSLYTSVQIYIMADKFDVGGLRLLACQRFWVVGKALLLNGEYTKKSNKRLKDQTHRHISKAISMVHDNTSPCDNGMHVVVGALLKAGLNDSRFVETMKPVIEKHRGLSVLMSVFTFGPGNEIGQR